VNHEAFQRVWIGHHQPRPSATLPLSVRHRSPKEGHNRIPLMPARRSRQHHDRASSTDREYDESSPGDARNKPQGGRPKGPRQGGRKRHRLDEFLVHDIRAPDQESASRPSAVARSNLGREIRARPRAAVGKVCARHLRVHALWDGAAACRTKGVLRRARLAPSPVDRPPSSTGTVAEYIRPSGRDGHGIKAARHPTVVHAGTSTAAAA
jgi:hypothetical protein